MNVNSRLFKVLIESWHNNSQKRETISYILIFVEKLVRRRKSKEWAKFELECLLLIFIYSNSKFKATCKNEDFKCRYIRTHTKEKPSKISNITFAIQVCLFIKKKKKKKKNWMAILSTVFGTYYFWWNHQMRFKMVHCSLKDPKSRVGESQVWNLTHNPFLYP